MAKFSCFFLGGGRKKKDKGVEGSSTSVEYTKKIRALQIKLEHPVKPFENDESKSTSFSISVPYDIQNNSPCNVKVMSHESPVIPIGVEPAEIAYEGEDEHEDTTSIKRDFSDLDLQAHDANVGKEEFDLRNTKSDYFTTASPEVNAQSVNGAEKDAKKGIDMIQSGHLSDPGVGRTEFWASPKLKRSCSNLESRLVLNKLTDRLPPSKSQSFEALQELSEKVRENYHSGSPMSVTSHFSADRVMLKKHSSSQILPSRSRRLWWKLFLWSHRNLHKPWILKPQPHRAVVLNQQGGYTSDTLEPNQATKLSKTESPGSCTGESLNKGCNGSYNEDRQSWDGFHNEVSAVWPQRQWVAFPAESSSFKRVDEWVKDLGMETPFEDDEVAEGVIFPPSPETGKSPARSTAHLTRRSEINLSEEILHANSVIRSLNSSSAVAHIAGIGLKAIPTISHFSSLRSVNLSNNFIVHIPTGSLPKGLHTLNLSRNKINTIEGLREMTRLRVLDLSYNRIFRIGHGLSNCTLIKELYLAGNKISDIEGLHRLLKLTVLDMSFNKITTTKALGQLVANYQSLLALNLLGNPIQSNISDDQLRKAVCSLLPKLVYLNKQPIKPQRARELLTDSIAKAVLGNSSQSSQRKAVKRTGRSGSLPSSNQRSSTSIGQRSRSKSKTRNHSHLASKTVVSKMVSSAQASSSR